MVRCNYVVIMLCSCCDLPVFSSTNGGCGYGVRCLLRILHVHQMFWAVDTDMDMNMEKLSLIPRKTNRLRPLAL